MKERFRPRSLARSRGHQSSRSPRWSAGPTGRGGYAHYTDQAAVEGSGAGRLVGRCFSSWLRRRLFATAQPSSSAPAGYQSAGGDRGGGAQVSALRRVRPRRGGVIRRARRCRGLRDGLLVGSDVTAEFVDADRPSSFHPLDGRDQQRQPVTFERRTSRCFHSHGGHGCRRADPASRLGYRQGRSAFIWGIMRAAVTAVSSSLNVASRAAALTAGMSSRASECCATSAASRTGANGAACRRRSTRHRLAGPPTSACRG